MSVPQTLATLPPHQPLSHSRHSLPQSPLERDKTPLRNSTFSHKTHHTPFRPTPTSTPFRHQPQPARSPHPGHRCRNTINHNPPPPPLFFHRPIHRHRIPCPFFHPPPRPAAHFPSTSPTPKPCACTRPSSRIGYTGSEQAASRSLHAVPAAEPTRQGCEAARRFSPENLSTRSTGSAMELRTRARGDLEISMENKAWGRLY